MYTDVGDPVASGIAVANGVVYFTTVASGKLVALDAATGKVLKEIDLGPVWSGPSVSRGRVYVGTGNTQFTPTDYEAYFPKKYTGVLYSFGLPGEDGGKSTGCRKGNKARVPMPNQSALHLVRAGAPGRGRRRRFAVQRLSDIAAESGPRD